MIQVPLVGAHFRPADAKEMLKSLEIGDTVNLRADPYNLYDRTAVAVYYDDMHLGFIPKESNSAVFESLMDGNEINAEIVAFQNALRPVLEFDLPGGIELEGQDDWG
jgi:hypothetical protein